jgi:adenylate cyclase
MTQADHASSPDSLPRRERPGWMAIAFIAICVLTGVAMYLAGARMARKPSVSPSIAVLPFFSLNSGAEAERFSASFTLQLAGALGNAAGVRMAGSTGAPQFDLRGADLREIGRRLGADVLVVGTVEKSGERMRVTVRLIRAANRYQLWEHSYEFGAQDAVASEPEVSCEIVSAVRRELHVR